MLRYASSAVLHGSNIREALEAASAILVAEGFPPIVVVDGDREYEKQVQVFLARYVLPHQVNGRRVYDFRWWEGRQYARISPAGTVAAPSRTAPHVAKIAADLGYPYNDRSTAAHKRLQQIAPGLGLDWTGRFFNEDWHWETTRGVGRTGAPAGEAVTVTSPEEDDMRAIIQAGVPDSGIIIESGVPPFPRVKQVFDAMCGAYGLTPQVLADWQYATVVREHWVSFNVAQRFASQEVRIDQEDAATIAGNVRKALEPLFDKASKS